MATMLVFIALLPGLAASLSLRDPGDVAKIQARGSPIGPLPPPLQPGQYILSAAASSFGRNESNALLDGAPEEIPLFKTGQAPLELPGDAPAQALFVNDPTDFCAAGDQSGYTITNVSDPTMVPFIVPLFTEGRRDAAVIIAPGGGTRYLSWSKEGTQVAKWLNSIGISAFVLKYRVPANSLQTNSKPLIDAQRAISLVRHRAPEYGLNRGLIGFMGFSAGAFLTGAVSETPNRVYEMVDTADLQSFRPSFALEIYGYGMIGANAPPTFVATAKDDPCVSAAGAVSYSAQLMNIPFQPHEVHVYSGGNHGYGDCSLYVNGNNFQPVCAWTLNAQLFMEKLFGVGRPLEKQAMTAPAPTM